MLGAVAAGLPGWNFHLPRWTPCPENTGDCSLRQEQVCEAEVGLKKVNLLPIHSHKKSPPSSYPLVGLILFLKTGLSLAFYLNVFLHCNVLGYLVYTLKIDANARGVLADHLTRILSETHIRVFTQH